jgi:hypothetical protein
VVVVVVVVVVEGHPKHARYNPTHAYRTMEHHIRKVGGYPFL